MTHTSTQQPEALRLARKFEEVGFMGDHRFAKDHWCRQAAAELRHQHARIEELEAQLSVTPAAYAKGVADTIRLNWLDAQVKNHAVHDGFLWQEGGWESNRGLVCAIQGKKQKKTVRQAIDVAIAAEAEQGGQANG